MSNSFSVSLGRFGNAVWAITLREYRHRYGGRVLGILWAYAEPTAYLVVATVVMTIALDHGSAPVGDSVPIFLAIGHMSYMVYSHAESVVRHAVLGQRNLLAFPRIKTIDLYTSKLVAEMSTLTIVYFFIYTILIQLGYSHLPNDFIGFLTATFFQMSLGAGMGLINSVIISYFSGWTSFCFVINRFNLYTCGLFFAYQGMPTSAQWFLKYQPVLHATEWMRQSYFSNFQSDLIKNNNYLLWFTGTVFAIGLLVERVFRSNMMKKS